jgi:hypothetical protein
VNNRELIKRCLVRGHDTPPPCFFWSLCGSASAIEKVGRSVCRGCAEDLRGIEYPLRKPTIEPLYRTGRLLAEALDIIEA